MASVAVLPVRRGAARVGSRRARPHASRKRASVASAALDNYEGDPEGSILAAVEAVEITRRADGIVLPEANQALAVVLDIYQYDQDLIQDPDEEPGRALVLSSEQLLARARDRVRRPMSREECRFFLHLDACPSATVPPSAGWPWSSSATPSSA